MFWAVVLAGNSQPVLVSAQAVDHILILDLGGSQFMHKLCIPPVTTVVAQISTSDYNVLVHNYDTIDWKSTLKPSCIGNVGAHPKRRVHERAESWSEQKNMGD